jgi:Tfp pilus assembly protein PilX
MNPAQRGTALVVTLLLLGGLGALALTAAAAAVAGLSLTGHQQFAQQAFEAAEAGVAHALALAARSRSEATINATPYPDEAGAASFEARIVRDTSSGPLPAGFSIGAQPGAFGAEQYYVVSDGFAGRDAGVRIEQGFYLVVPDGGP